jgi:hypothetical protein
LHRLPSSPKPDLLQRCNPEVTILGLPDVVVSIFTADD